ncbi:MAG: tRNA (N6-isopentenyl adenosine(37)-C2)-methylthiotransferase MiaB [Thermodesulfobacteriota bacterium]|nr:tRNA (N6-isopentenyl adenosine(37)-C2)-methylthiotransferase MiaB [Thermodesulfobacteriota bacterium]
MKTKYLYINTIGCQMNVYDSDQIAKSLRLLNYETTENLGKADLIIANTCAIREKAEQKVFSFLGRLAGLKRKKPGLIIGVGGCVAQQEGSKILQRVPFVDIVFGTHAIPRLAEIIERVESKKIRMVDIGMTEKIEEIDPVANLTEKRPQHGKVSAFVTIMQGCDNFCTYCVVPYVRGREASRSPEKIVREIEGLVDIGVREVTLLGQNVNSYGKKEGLCSFSELLARINQISGISRIRFTTSHPKDLSDDLIMAFKDNEKLCRHIHLPVQSGSDRVLKRMNRKYTRTMYLEKIDKLRNICPDISITSDFIVGFPGETGADFKETLDLITTVEYEGLFAFKYSDRPNAKATSFTQKISRQEKKERLKRLLDLQEIISRKKNQALVGSTQEILVEGFSKKMSSVFPGVEKAKNNDSLSHDIQWTGRTSGNKIVNFNLQKITASYDESFIGRMVNVEIEKAFSHSLWGRYLKLEPTPLKGEESYAA